MKNAINVHQNFSMEKKGCQPESVASLDEIQVCLIKVTCVELMIFVNCLILFVIFFS